MNNGTTSPSPQPRLLVSVRNAVEAHAALSGGCTLLDIKEPRHGSLGMADPRTIEDVVASATRSFPDVPISTALGELLDWNIEMEIPCLPRQVRYAKLGTAGLGDSNDWVSRWQETRQDFDKSRRARFDWIAVTYADWQVAQAPAPDTVVNVAVSERAAPQPSCVGVLFDTYAKNGSSLLDKMPVSELVRLADKIRKAGLLLALAGSLSVSDLHRLTPIRPDIIAIRSAACVGGQRLSRVSADTVRNFNQALSAAHTGHQPRVPLIG